MLKETILRSVNLQEPLHEFGLKSRGIQVRHQPSFAIPVVEDIFTYAKLIGQGMLFYFNLNNVKVMLLIGCLTCNLLLQIFRPKPPQFFFSCTSKIFLSCNLLFGQIKAKLTYAVLVMPIC